jgi:hypothetical protein
MDVLLCRKGVLCRMKDTNEYQARQRYEETAQRVGNNEMRAEAPRKCAPSKTAASARGS